MYTSKPHKPKEVHHKGFKSAFHPLNLKQNQKPSLSTVNNKSTARKCAAREHIDCKSIRYFPGSGGYRTAGFTGRTESEGAEEDPQSGRQGTIVPNQA